MSDRFGWFIILSLIGIGFGLGVICAAFWP